MNNKDKDKSKTRLKGALNSYMQWPLYLTALLLCMVVSIALIDKKAAGIMLLYTGVYFVIVMNLYIFKRKYITDSLSLNIETLDEEEEKRIFYVALSRAKNKFYVTYPSKKIYGQNVYDRLPTPYLKKLPKEVLCEKSTY